MRTEATLRIRPNTTDPSVFRSVYLRETFDAVRSLPGAPTRILDLGAYTGISTRWFCDEFPNALVVGVEPYPKHYELARKNAPDAVLLQVAVGAGGREAYVRESDRGEWAAHTRPGDDDRAISVGSVRTVDQIAKATGGPFEVVKMDVEGAEKEVFESDALDWLDSVELLFVETHDRFLPGCTQALFAALGRKGLSCTRLPRRGSSADYALRLRR